MRGRQEMLETHLGHTLKLLHRRPAWCFEREVEVELEVEVAGVGAVETRRCGCGTSSLEL